MYSSDTPQPACRGFVPPQNDDERRLMHRVEELCRVAEVRGIPRYTGFLSDREQSLAQAACNKAGGGIVARSDEEYELQEVNNKLGALRHAIEMAEKL